MELIPLNRAAQFVARVCMVLLLLAAVILSVMNYTSLTVHQDIQRIKMFLAKAENIQPNFESSLQLYTENLEGAIKYVHSLRPDDELDYISVISRLEEIGQDLGLNLALNSLNAPTAKKDEKSNTLDYQARFFGTRDDVIKFLAAVEDLPYYFRVTAVNYKTIAGNETKDYTGPNIDITLQLYVK